MKFNVLSKLLKIINSLKENVKKIRIDNPFPLQSFFIDFPRKKEKSEKNKNQWKINGFNGYQWKLVENNESGSKHLQTLEITKHRGYNGPKPISNFFLGPTLTHDLPLRGW